jgi:hypothetical protein
LSLIERRTLNVNVRRDGHTIHAVHRHPIMRRGRRVLVVARGLRHTTGVYALRARAGGRSQKRAPATRHEQRENADVKKPFHLQVRSFYHSG